ncbi:MAG: shikimate dehydrogenase [Nocardioidaceae bacterium]
MSVTAPTGRCAVLGRPIAHSLSPALHRAAYAATGLDWTYDPVEVGADELAGFLDGLDGSWRGLSMTMPLKRVAIPLLDELSDRAAQAQAANTVVLRDGRRTGHNTDIPGAARALRERYDGPVRSAVILGGGATASSTLLALADLGCREVTLVVRDEARAAETLAAAARHPHPPHLAVRQFGTPVRPADVLVSTIPAAAQDAAVLALARLVPVLFDVVYDPWPTPLAGLARDTGATLVAGLDLLVHQAVLQFQLMTGSDADVTGVMRAAGERALAAR